MATTRLGVGGPSAAYPGFTAKAADEADSLGAMSRTVIETEPSRYGATTGASRFTLSTEEG